jgi:predicted ATP-grasp superfamily ATP-dependent carboligase
MSAAVPVPRVPLLVLDGEQRASLAVTRALLRSGYAVIVAAHQETSLAGAVRGVSRCRVHKDPLCDPLGYAAEVAALAGACSAVVVLPVTDASAGALLAHRDLLPKGCVVPYAPLSVYDAASDKVVVHRHALARGIAITETWVIEHPDSPLPPGQAVFPGVIKPHRSVVGEHQKQRTSVQFVADRDECARKLAELDPAAFPVLVQRRIHGLGEGLFFARWQGRTIARFAHRRLREKPPAGGVSVYSESIDVEPGLLAACEDLLDSLQWQGVAMIEGKRDKRTGRWCIMEINGRFWGSLQLAIDAGVDFPALLVRAALDGTVQEPPPWRRGVRLRWEWGDLDHLLLRLVRSNERLSLPADAPGRLKTLWQWCAFLPWRDKLEVFRVRDPLPFWVETRRRLGLLK